MTVRELLERIDSRELTEWAVYFGLEPWGTEVDDWRRVSAATIANVNRIQSNGENRLNRLTSCPGGSRRLAEEQSVEEQARILETWARTLAAREGGSK